MKSEYGIGISEYQQFIHKSRYARYLDSEKRRETWEETVERYCNFMGEQAGAFPDAFYEGFNDC